MDYEEMESELETAGIDPFDFALMDEVERQEALEDAFLDPDDFEDFDLEYPGRFSHSPSYVPVPPALPRETKAIGIGDLSGSHGRITSLYPSPILCRAATRTTRHSTPLMLPARKLRPLPISAVTTTLPCWVPAACCHTPLYIIRSRCSAHSTG